MRTPGYVVATARFMYYRETGVNMLSAVPEESIRAELARLEAGGIVTEPLEVLDVCC